MIPGLFAMTVEEAERLINWQCFVHDADWREYETADGELVDRLRLWRDRERQHEEMLAKVDSYIAGDDA